MGLTVKQEKFANLYVELGNASEAYRQAYNVKDSTSIETINVSASKLLADPKITLRVEELRNEVKESHCITRDFIVKGLLEIINDVDYTFKLGKDNSISDADKKVFFRLMNQTKNTDKLRALEQLAKMLGLNEPEKQELKQTIEIVEKSRD